MRSRPPHRLPPPDQSTLTSGGPQGLPFSADTQLTQSGGNRETIKWLGVGWVGRASRMFCLSCVGKQWQIHKRQSSDPLNDNKSPLEGLKAHTLHSCWGWRLCVRASQEVLVVKNLPANAGDIRDLGSIPWWGRFPVGEPTATPSSILACRIPQAEEPGGLQSIGSQRVGLKPQSTVVSYSFVITIKILLISARQWSFKLKKLLNW